MVGNPLKFNWSPWAWALYNVVRVIFKICHAIYIAAVWLLLPYGVELPVRRTRASLRYLPIKFLNSVLYLNIFLWVASEVKCRHSVDISIHGQSGKTKIKERLSIRLKSNLFRQLQWATRMSAKRTWTGRQKRFVIVQYVVNFQTFQITTVVGFSSAPTSVAARGPHRTSSLRSGQSQARNNY